MIPIIQEYIRENTIIITDSAPVYFQLSTLGYIHHKVNHSIEFVNSQHGYSTNHIESLWQKFKTGNKIRYGTHRTTLSSHIGEFMWRKKFGKSLTQFFNDIKEEYTF